MSCLRLLFLSALICSFSLLYASEPNSLEMNVGSPQAHSVQEISVVKVHECIYQGKPCRLVRGISNSFIQSHASDFHLGHDSFLWLNDRALAPFGVYGLDVDGVIVGLHSIIPLYHGEHLVASVITDIFKKYRSSGYGTLLRKLAGQELEKSIGMLGRIKTQSGEELTKYPLSYLFSNNEWNYGKNGASTYSALKAGYGIACISGPIGLVKMLYPMNESLWQESRTQNFVSASRILGAYRKNHKEAIPFLVNIIHDLDLTQQVDVETLDSLVAFMDGPDVDCQLALDTCINGLSKNNLDLLIQITKGIHGAEIVQKIPAQLLSIGGNLSEQVKESLCKRLKRLKLVVSVN